MSSFASLGKNLGGLVDHVKAKAQDAVHEAASVQRRLQQQAMEAAGISSKADDDDDLPELKCEHALPSPGNTQTVPPRVFVRPMPWRNAPSHP